MKSNLNPISRLLFALLFGPPLFECIRFALAGVMALTGTVALGGGNSAHPKTYDVADGRIEIKPRLKYELMLSLHVLRCAEDHHQLFTNWAQQVRASLKPATLRQTTNLNAIV